ncbi:2Fe-2S ferredoxin [Thermoanaerobacter kivui]|uniref:2Fe-2S ferredoxin n=1 Tax=Thermoanaerobacter kivui TaxID=2325 RepID=A0A097ATK2_THEKI|nr:corrinoid activation/regeneration protein AcsV [Thermoanaerobacter kivui]AIS53124.1 2Fe-2S ferredoxin [Thermoanaerobacter kivui]
MEKCTVIFKPSNKSISVTKGTNLLEAARKAGVFIDAPCGGKGRCGKCRVKIISGDYKEEITSLLTSEDRQKGIRLACLTFVEGDMIVEVEESKQVQNILVEGIKPGDEKNERVLKASKLLEEEGIKKECGVFNIDIELPEPSIDDNVADFERLKRELKVKYNIENFFCSLNVLKNMPKILRENNFKVRATFLKGKNGCELIRIKARNKETSTYGICVDIGTTTVAVNLIDLESNKIIAAASSGNLQMQYGGDVISRIIYASTEGGLEKIKSAVVDGTINRLIDELVKKANIEKQDIIISTFAGNTTMTHLFLGVEPAYIRVEPYIPAFRECPELKAKDIGIDINPEAKVIVIPNVASYVGGDIVSGVLATGIWKEEKNVLFMDLGTNGEIVFGNKDLMLTCACSAGPAFEGGEISCGMRAMPGAIDEISIDRKTLEPKIRVIGNVKPKGICGSGLIDLLAEMFLSGIINSKGEISKELESDRIRFDEDLYVMEYVVVWGKETADGRDITINEIDISNFLKAKGAVYSGSNVLLKSVGFSMDDVDKVIIAGGIGQNLHIENAIMIGLLPDIDRSKFSYIGNSSLLGAYLCLLYEQARDKVKEIADAMTYVELSVYPSYMDEFISACFLPHTDMNLFPSVMSLLNQK